MKRIGSATLGLLIFCATYSSAGVLRPQTADSLVSSDGTKTWSFTSASDTLMGIAATQTVSNKTFVAPVLGDATGTSLSVSGNSTESNSIMGVTNSAFSALPLTLTSASKHYQFVNGTTSSVGIITLPTYSDGLWYHFYNSTTAGTISVKNSGGTLVVGVLPGQHAVVYAVGGSNWLYDLLPPMKTGDVANTGIVRDSGGQTILDSVFLDGNYSGSGAGVFLYPNASTATSYNFIFPGANALGYMMNDGSGNMSFTTNVLVNSASDATNAHLVVNNTHIKSTQTTAPTTSVKSAAGTGASCSVSNATDSAGIITLTFGSGSFSSGDQCDINFNMTYNVAPICVVSANNAATANDQSSTHQIYYTTTTAHLSVNLGVQQNSAGAVYSFMYRCIETQ